MLIDYDKLRLKYLLTGETVYQIKETLDALNLVAQKPSKCWFGCTWKQTPKIKILTEILEKVFWGKEKTVEKSAVIWAQVCTDCGNRRFYIHISGQQITELSQQKFNNALSQSLG